VPNFAEGSLPPARSARRSFPGAPPPKAFSTPFAPLGAPLGTDETVPGPALTGLAGVSGAGCSTCGRLAIGHPSAARTAVVGRLAAACWAALAPRLPFRLPAEAPYRNRAERRREGE